jgi:hypothetical protein
MMPNALTPSVTSDGQTVHAAQVAAAPRLFPEPSSKGTISLLRIWILRLYLMGPNLSNLQIAAELDLNKDDVQNMTKALRSGVNAKKTLIPTQRRS